MNTNLKRLLIVLLALAIVGFVAFWIFVGFGGGTAANPGGNAVTLPGSSNVQTPTQSSGASVQTMSVVSQDGSTIGTKNFLHASTTGQYTNSGYYYLGYHTQPQGVTDPTATNDPPYLIEYIGATKYFNVELLHEPIGATRTNAENFLLAQLGITKSDMCKLDYMVSVPTSVNEYYAGKNLGFSFCPGATQLPQ